MDIKEVRKKIFERDSNKCYKCESTKKLVMDHVKPKSIFHYHGIDNILTLCWDCNNLKFTKILPQNEFEEIKHYLNKANQRFTINETTEMTKVIEEYFTTPRKPKKKLKKKCTKNDISAWREYCNTHTWEQSQKFLHEQYPQILNYETTNWKDLAITDKDGKLKRHTIYRMRD
jgi:hypothetical protein